MPSTSKSNKLRLIFVITIIIFLIIIVKLFYLQLINPYTVSSEYLRTRKILAERGQIYDRNSQPLVMNQTTYLLYVEPKKLEEKDRAIRSINQILHLDEASIEATLNTDLDWLPLTKGLTKEDKDNISKLKIKGLGFDEEYRRYYPESSLAAQLLGFVGKNKDGDNVGYFGVEGFYDKDLAGLPGLLK